MNIEAITQQGQTIAVYKEIESSRLMEAMEIEEADRIKQIDEAQEFNALMDAEVMINQGGFFDLYV
ncbi:MAG: hypothetical protein CME35_00965 [Gramella sp.]|uniref:Uncharacterized protein n=1 Tax=marine metagenome TaxID=408172 RepID=A0A382SD97_9ZZZZ|nr:hypothetical protein [Christiangramia sp.]|tara:strand:- start:6781 stop:6978 length:198 start_codon:yes stop_codon:yes gene_type:complete